MKSALIWGTICLDLIKIFDCFKTINLQPLHPRFITDQKSQIFMVKQVVWKKDVGSGGIDLNLEKPQLKSREIIFLVHFDICYSMRASFSHNLHNSWSIKQLH